MVKLGHLLHSHPYLRATLSHDTDVSAINIAGVSAHSGNIDNDFLFVAKQGSMSGSRNGHDYIDDAIKRGAKAVVVQNQWTGPKLDIPLIRAQDSSIALAHLCESFYGWPSKKMTVIGITGTNGKTSTTFMLYSILKAAGHRPATMGTLGLGEPGSLRPLNHTTAEPEVLSACLDDLWRQGFSHVVMEVSSHALHLHRVEALSFAAVAFTNLSQDHLDFHGTMKNYQKAKERLFLELAAPTTFKILPRNHELSPHIAELSSTLLYDPTEKLPQALPFFGDFHTKNALLASNIAKVLGVSDSFIAEGLRTCPPISGRLEPIYEKGPHVFVDFAHTPDALLCALKALRPLCKGQLTLVFGCGGDRDQKKRAIMAQVASELADRLIITDDNPRSEDPADIRAAIMAGIPKGCMASEIADRKEAIRKAIIEASSRDYVLIAGKGHEQHQIYGNKEIAFSDQKEALEAVEQLCKT